MFTKGFGKKTLEETKKNLRAVGGHLRKYRKEYIMGTSASAALSSARSAKKLEPKES